jgi:hypothetical protein
LIVPTKRMFGSSNNLRAFALSSAMVPSLKSAFFPMLSGVVC